MVVGAADEALTEKGFEASGRRGPRAARRRRRSTGARGQESGRARVLAGLATVAIVVGLIAVPVGLFRGSFTTSVPVTVLSKRAGLVMYPDAKVKMRGVPVGKVGDIEARPDGTAVLQLQLNPDQLRLIPANVSANITSSTVFGAKFVDLVAPPDPSARGCMPVRSSTASTSWSRSTPCSSSSSGCWTRSTR